MSPRVFRTHAHRDGFLDMLLAASGCVGMSLVGQFVHEDHKKGVLAFERVSSEPFERLLVVVNAGSYQSDEPTYGVKCGCNSTWTVRQPPSRRLLLSSSSSL